MREAPAWGALFSRPLKTSKQVNEVSQRFDGYLRGCSEPFFVNRYYSESPAFYVSGPSAAVWLCVAAGLIDRTALALVGPPLCKPCPPASSRLWCSCCSLLTPLPPPDLAAFQGSILIRTLASSLRTIGHSRSLWVDTLTRSAASWDASH